MPDDKSMSDPPGQAKGKDKGRRPQEEPPHPEPPTTDEDRLISAVEALQATGHAWIDFCEAPDWSRKTSAFRNFLCNGTSVTFLIQGLRHGREQEFAEWYAPIRTLLRDDPLFRFFWQARTDSIHRIAPRLGFRHNFTVPQGAVRMDHTPWIGEDLKPYVMVVMQDGQQRLFKPDRWSYIVEGLPAVYKDHPLELLMQRYVYALQDIVRRACAQFAPDMPLDDP